MVRVYVVREGLAAIGRLDMYECFCGEENEWGSGIYVTKQTKRGYDNSWKG